ncbi:MAG: mechanosensitive ion channel domain-containing protein [Pseudomonadota bacterium]
MGDDIGFWSLVGKTIQVVVVFGIVFLAGRFVQGRLDAIYADKPQHAFRRQLYMAGGLLAGVLALILLLPLSRELTGQLLGLFGIVVSATIALSSTTLVGNIMAGITLRIVDNIKPGDFIACGEYFGRVSEMDLLHVEIQTEQRDLTTLPNLYLVQNPTQVMHSSGTILSVDLSLGYDVPRRKIEKVLIDAATATGLEKPYVEIRALGDFSVTYVVSGLLTELNKLIGKRRELRAHTLDGLHDAGIEIVSPTFMNTRAYTPDTQFIPKREWTPVERPDAPAEQPDSLVFDKAEKAESLAKLKEQRSSLEERLKECQELRDKESDDARKRALADECEQIEQRLARLAAVIEAREAQISSS